MINEKLKLLLFGSAVWYLGEGMFGPLFAIFSESIGGNILDITSAWAVYLFATGILIIVIGHISDTTVKKEKLMIFGYALNALFTFGWLFVTRPEQLFIVQIGLGIAAALATPTWEALYSNHSNKKKMGFMWGFFEGTTNMITAFAIVIGGLIVNFYSFKILFIIMGTIQVIATIAQALILRDK
ncbi:MAG: MFS transporter [Candidatus Aenigmarchaeota archaeon]|nr:MFS transporter [Candidatus Aenigmarchaeota archaeon]